MLFLVEGTFSLEKWKSKWLTVINMCFQKLCKIRFYITKHVKWCSISNRDHCGITSVIFNTFREQKYWWKVWLVRGSPSEWAGLYRSLNWESNVRSSVRGTIGPILDLGFEALLSETEHRVRGRGHTNYDIQIIVVILKVTTRFF